MISKLKFSDYVPRPNLHRILVSIIEIKDVVRGDRRVRNTFAFDTKNHCNNSNRKPKIGFRQSGVNEMLKLDSLIFFINRDKYLNQL